MLAPSVTVATAVYPAIAAVSRALSPTNGKLGLVAFGDYFGSWPAQFALRCRKEPWMGRDVGLPYTLGGFDGTCFRRVLADDAPLRRCRIRTLLSDDIDEVHEALDRRQPKDVGFVTAFDSAMPAHFGRHLAWTVRDRLSLALDDDAFSAVFFVSQANNFRQEPEHVADFVRHRSAWHESTARYLRRCDPGTLDDVERSIV